MSVEMSEARGRVAVRVKVKLRDLLPFFVTLLPLKVPHGGGLQKVVKKKRAISLLKAADT